MSIRKKKIALLLSGGIDSSMSAFILKKNFFYIECIFIKNWESYEKKTCFFQLDLFHVKKVCKKLNAKLHILNYTKTYWTHIFINFLSELKSGLTPNPDILCNRKIKFQFFLNYAFIYLKFDFIATGHYSSLNFHNKNMILYNNFDYKKNQNYFLYKIRKKNIKKVLFPLTNYLKIELRKFTKFFFLINFNKKSSTGICFIGEKNFKNFIGKYLKKNCGNVLDNQNKLIGKHNGLFFYTLGQKFNDKINKSNLFVYEKDCKRNILYVTTDKKFLFFNKILIKNIDFKINRKKVYYVKTRHTFYFDKAIIFFNYKHKRYLVMFKKAQHIVSAGQSIVFYDNNFCIGGAIICKSI